MKIYLSPFLLCLIIHSSPILFSQDIPPPSHEESLPAHSQFRHQDLLEEPREHALPERESDTFHTKFLNMLFILGLLIGFMILASWALKRLMKTKVHQLNASSTIRILETRYLSPRATLYLIEVHDQILLIAESPTQMSQLASFSQEESPSTHSSPPSFSNFAQTNKNPR